MNRNTQRTARKEAVVTHVERLQLAARENLTPRAEIVVVGAAGAQAGDQ
jgi:hypothetical protein